MLELIKTSHQKSAILLRKTEGGLTLASFVIFDQFNNSKLLGQKLLTTAELKDITEQKDALEKRNIFIIDEPKEDPVILIPSGLTVSEYGETISTVPSPYFSNLFREAEFFSTQKTRGPNE